MSLVNRVFRCQVTSSPVSEKLPTKTGLLGTVGIDTVGDVGYHIYMAGRKMEEEGKDPITKILGTGIKTGGDVVIVAGDDVIGRLAGDTVTGLGQTVINLACNLERFPFLGPLLKQILAAGGELTKAAGGDQYD